MAQESSQPRQSTNAASPSTASQPGQPNSQADRESRRRQGLVSMLTSRTEAKEARKRKRNGAPLEIQEMFKLAARMFARCYSPFIPLFFCFRVGSVCDVNNATDPTTLLVPDDPQVSNLTLEERTNYVNAYKAFLQMQPGLAEYFLNTDESVDPEAMAAVVELISDTARAARSDDTTGLKQPGLNYILLDLDKSDDPTGDSSRTLLAAVEKNQRGFNNVVTGRLLCPHRYSEQFKEDPTKTCEKFLTGVLPCKASLFPAFLYDGPYNDADKYEGLLRGPLCVRVYKHIFTGPSSAGGKGSSNQQNRRKNQSQLMGIERTTPRTIAYAVVQARHLLNQQSDWTLTDDHFASDDFFNMIVALLECDDTVNPTTRAWITDTLDWWDRQVFNKGPRGDEHDQGNGSGQDSDDDDDFRALMAQRRRTGDK